MPTITRAGLVPKTQNEYFEDEIELYRDIDSNWDLEPSTPDGLKAAHDAEIFGNLDEVIQHAYNSKDPASAIGRELDIICAINAITRGLGAPSFVTVTFSGANGSVIPRATRIEDPETGLQFSTEVQVTIPASGTVNTLAICTVNGANHIAANKITRIIDVVAGVSSVTNPAAATAGTDPENDRQLRVRRNRSVGRSGNNQIDSMIGEIFSVEGVSRVRIYENSTHVTVNSIPARSMGVIVDGGLDADVAKAIFRKKAVGARLVSIGDSVTVNNVFDLYPTNTATILFNRPLSVAQNVVVNISNDGSLPATADREVIDSILDYSEGLSISQDVGFKNTGYDIGEPVPISQLFTAVNRVIGFYGNSYISSLTINGNSTGVSPISFYEIARFSAANIRVNIT